MENEGLEIGTLMLDNGKIGIIVNVMKSGSLKTAVSIINWRENYEIYYFDGQATVIGTETVNRLIREGKIVVIKDKEPPSND